MDALDANCDRIMRRYDYHHRAFKMYIAKGKPMEFHISIRLFSFAGFLRYQTIIIVMSLCLMM